MAGHHENRRKQRYDKRAFALAESRVLPPLPGNSPRTPRHGFHLHEPFRQYAGAGQCRHPDGTESHERASGAESEKRYRYQPDDYVSGNEHIRVDTDTRQHHDVPLANGRCAAYGHFHPYADYYRHLYHCRCHRRQHCATDKPAEQTHSYSDRLHQSVLLRAYLPVHPSKPRRNGRLLHAGCQHHSLYHHPAFHPVGIMEKD